MAKTTHTIDPKRVRYIKLGKGGGWEKECIESGIVRIGFGSADNKRFELCRKQRWDDLAQSFIANGRDPGTATRFVNELRQFFEDDGSTLWITFVGEQLCWGFVDSTPPHRHKDGDGVFRNIAGGWKLTDTTGETLTKDRLSGALVKLAAYRGTSCNVDVDDYVIRRINGKKMPEVERAVLAAKAMKTSILELMQLLTWRDFETLVDLVFSTSGWRRVGRVGGTQKTLDLDLMLPSTGERAFVQVKAKTNSAELADYVGRLEDLGPYDRMFYVFHSGEAKTTDERVTVIGPEELANLVMDAGLASWLMQKAS